MNIAGMLMGGGGGLANVMGGNALAGNPAANSGPANQWGIDSLMKALGGMGGGGQQQGQAGGGGDQKKKSLDALLMLATILQQANATHNSTSLGGGMSGFGFGGGLR